MGAGKGQTKRAQSSHSEPNAQSPLTDSPSSTSEASFDIVKWNDFVLKSGLEDVKLHRYYLGKTPRRPSEAEYTQVVEGLFQDAVTVGAITIPHPYTTNDFSFRTVQKIYRSRTSKKKYLAVHIKRKNELGEGREIFTAYTVSPLHNVYGSGGGSGDLVTIAVGSIVLGINKLLRSEQYNN